MALPIEGYGVIGDTHTAALVGRDGSIDWFCVPRFDSAACFAALLGDESHGRWKLAPDAQEISQVEQAEPGHIPNQVEQRDHRRIRVGVRRERFVEVRDLVVPRLAICHH